MCAIFGYYRDRLTCALKGRDKDKLAATMDALSRQCSTRGRDGTGWELWGTTLHADMSTRPVHASARGFDAAVYGELDQTIRQSDRVNAIIGNCRAEPTTEWQAKKRRDNLQPYTQSGVTIVHNGTIANDRNWLAGWPPHTIDSQAIAVAAAAGQFDQLVGSQATAVYASTRTRISPDVTLEAGELMLHRNFRPLAVIYVPSLSGWLFASKLEFILDSLPVNTPYHIQDLPANSQLVIPSRGMLPRSILADRPEHAVVILSGGLDSTTVAKEAVLAHPTITFIHFLYGCRAQSKETQAVTAIHQRLVQEHPDRVIKLEFIDMSFLKQLGGSTLTDPDATIAKGEEGAEYAHEWVPFRNGLMLSSVVAYCDRHKCTHIYLGTNLEEAGAYGDNEQEFYELMGKAIAIGSQSAPTIVNPLENLMKHEIVALSAKNRAPVDLSWSCYHGGLLHCGDCGPCYMRRKAFAMNQLQDSVEYLDATQPVQD